MGAIPVVSTAELVADAVAVGRGLGLRVDEPVVLSDNLNLLVHLRPSPVVARIQNRTGLVRDAAVLGDSLGLAAFLAGRGLPVSLPVADVEPGPHLGRAGRLMTLWRHLEIVDEPVDPAAAGRSLGEIHAAAADFDGPLRHAGPLVEIDRLADLVATDRPGDAARLRAFRALLAPVDGPIQALHGDSHLGNVAMTRQGLVWLDWEESWRGPAAWDLACLDHRRAVFGEIATEIAAAFDGFGPVDEAALDAWRPAVALWAAAWGVLAATETGVLGERAVRRLDWLAERFRLPDSGPRSHDDGTRHP